MHVAAPPGLSVATWRAVIEVLRGADVWGSTDTTGTPKIWAEVEDGQQP